MAEVVCTCLANIAISFYKELISWEQMALNFMDMPEFTCIK